MWRPFTNAEVLCCGTAVRGNHKNRVLIGCKLRTVLFLAVTLCKIFCLLSVPWQSMFHGGLKGVGRNLTSFWAWTLNPIDESTYYESTKSLAVIMTLWLPPVEGNQWKSLRKLYVAVQMLRDTESRLCWPALLPVVFPPNYIMLAFCISHLQVYVHIETYPCWVPHLPHANVKSKTPIWGMFPVL